MRRRFAPTLPSETILRKPISVVRRDVRASAQLLAEVADLEHAHEVAVLLAEQRRHARFARRRERRLVRAHGVVLEDLAR